MELECCDPFLCSWNCTWAEMNTCFSTSLKALFLQPFSKCRFTFCLVCGCYFRNVSWGGHPWLIPHACALTTHTQMQKHTCMHTTQPLTTPPKSFQCLSLENLGFWFVVLSPHSTSSTICLFSTCPDWRERIFIRVPFWSSPGYFQNILHSNKREKGGRGEKRKGKLILFKLVKGQEFHKIP